MKNFSFILLVVLIANRPAFSQQEKTTYKNFPLIISIQFHNLAMPFKDLKSNFSHIGLGLGTEIGFNKKGTWTQQIGITWHKNKQIGNGFMASTQTVWRQKITSDFFGEVKAGATYLYSFRPVESWKQQNGEWVNVGHTGKGMFALPIGISVGYNTNNRYSLAPFVSYQALFVTGYNTSIPLVPQSLIQVGSRINIR